MNSEYICPYCYEPSLSIKGIKRHVEREHPEKIKEFNKILLHDLNQKSKI